MTITISKLSRTIASLIAIASIGILTACGGGSGIAGPRVTNSSAQGPAASSPEQGSALENPVDEADNDQTYDPVTGEVIQ